MVECDHKWCSDNSGGLGGEGRCNNPKIIKTEDVPMLAAQICTFKPHKTKGTWDGGFNDPPYDSGRQVKIVVGVNTELHLYQHELRRLVNALNEYLPKEI